MSELFPLPSPIQLLQSSLLSKKNIQLFVKRDDLIHPYISGNKWRKLKYNLAAAKRLKHSTLLTFGGAFSNHIAATAVAGQYFDFQTIGIIRGERIEPLNPTLQLAVDHGMQLHFVNRSAYRTPDRLTLAETLVKENFYYLPEGGTNNLALKGCQEIITEDRRRWKGQFPDYVCVSCGTGGTLSGIVEGMNGMGKVLGFSALKGDFLTHEVKDLLAPNHYDNWEININYHFGGYAKFKPELITLINEFKREHGISLDPIYTGKLFFGLFDLIEKGYFPKGSSILAIHTGGLQGIQGFNQRFGDLLET